MGILEKHQKKDIRFEAEDIIFYEPTEIQLELIQESLKGDLKINNDLDVSGEVGIGNIRLIIRELTNIGSEIDEYSEDEIVKLIDNGDRTLTLLIREITKFINELVEDLQFQEYRIIDFSNKFINIITANETSNKIEEKLNKLLKRQGLNMTVKEFNEIKDNPVEIEKAFKKINKKKK